jgi:ferritin-like metal-binding protein YciE
MARHKLRTIGWRHVSLPPKTINNQNHVNIMKSLKDLFLSELEDMYDSEHRITKALPDLIKAATCSSLQNALQNHLQETEGHVTKVEAVFEAFDEKPKRKKCPAIIGILDEGDDLVSENKSSATINAAIICAGQKVEHYEIATYGCLHAWANQLGNTRAANLLEEILDEEKAADEGLTEHSVAKNQEAFEQVEVGAAVRH